MVKRGGVSKKKIEEPFLNEDKMRLFANLLIDQFLREKHLIATNSHNVYNENILPLQ